MAGRNLGSLPLSQVQANEFDWSYFVRIDVASPIGTKRFTDRYCGPTTPPAPSQQSFIDTSARTTSLSIDGSTQLWSEDDVVVGGLDQGQQTMLAVSWLSFANLEETPGAGPKWTGWANNPGLANAPVKVWHVRFDPATGAFVEKILMYDGKVDNARYGSRAELALRSAPIRRLVPTATAQLLGAGPIMPDLHTTIYWGDFTPRS
jgi:hypothetical protein